MTILFVSTKYFPKSSTESGEPATPSPPKGSSTTRSSTTCRRSVEALRVGRPFMTRNGVNCQVDRTGNPTGTWGAYSWVRERRGSAVRACEDHEASVETDDV